MEVNMDKVYTWVDVKTTLIAFSSCFLIRMALRIKSWWKKKEEVKNDNYEISSHKWKFNWMKTKQDDTKEEPPKVPETRNFLAKSFNENTKIEIIGKLMLICLVLIPWLATRAYLILEIAVLRSPIFVFDFINYTIKSFIVPLWEKALFPLFKNIFELAESTFQSVRVPFEKAISFIRKLVINVSYLLLDFLRTLFAVLKSMASTCYITFRPILIEIAKVFFKILFQIICSLFDIYSNVKPKVSFLYRRSIIPMFESLKFCINYISHIMLTFLTKIKHLTVYFYQEAFIPVSKLIKFYLSRLLEISIKLLHWLLYTCSQLKQMAVFLYFNICFPMFKQIEAKVMKPLGNIIFHILQALISSSKMLIIPVMQRIMLFLVNVIYYCYTQIFSCYFLMSSCFYKIVFKLYNFLSAIFDFIFKFVSPIFLVLYTSDSTFLLLSFHLFTIVGTQVQVIFIQVYTFIIDMYVKLYDAAILPVYEIFLK